MATSFSTLPTELRLKIWEHTFEPRTLSIALHVLETPEADHTCHPGTFRCMTPIRRDVPTSARLCAFPAPTIQAILFTARLGLHLNEPSQGFLTSSLFASFRNRPLYRSCPFVAAKPLPGPLALQICRESRAVTLEHYKLAFPGYNASPASDPYFSTVFKEQKLGEARIWVNFSLDEILISWMDPKISSWGANSHYTAAYISLLSLYATGDAMRIERLAVQGQWRLEEEWEATTYFARQTFGLCTSLINSLKDYKRRKELRLFCLEEGGRTERELEREVLETLESERRKSVSSALTMPRLPTVSVSKDLMWFRDREYGSEWRLQSPIGKYPGNLGPNNVDT